MLKIVGASLALLSVPTTATASPVERVVNLLKDLKGKTEADGKNEQQVYDKYACWCETTSKRKADAIDQAAADLRSLGQSILKYKSRIAVLTSELDQIKQDMKKNQEEQDEATNIRQKESAAYQAEAKEMKQAIAAMQKATQVLVTGSKAALLQEGSSAAVASAAGRELSTLLLALPQTVGDKAKPEHLALLADFAKAAMEGRVREHYAPQSATIQGILKDMYETFSKDLESNTGREADANRDYETFIGQKEEAMAILKETKASSEVELAETEQLLADTTENYDTTEEQRKADIEFFDVTKEACEEKSEEWNVRVEMRTMEMEGFDKALEILTSDEARELFAKSIKPGKETGGAASFLQLDASQPSEKAYSAMKKAATKTHSFRLAALAVKVRASKSGHFGDVIKAIDDMVATLKEEGLDDMKKRDQCKSEYTATSSVIKKTEWLVEKNLAKIDKLERLIADRTKQREETIASIAETEQQIEDITNTRKDEHMAFKQAKEDDEGALVLLNKAKDVLKKFYDKHADMGKLQLIQEPEFAVSEDQAPDADFSSKGKNRNQAKGIVSIMAYIIEDLEDEIKGDAKSEGTSQMEYEKQLSAAEKVKEDLIAKKADLKQQITNFNEKKTEENEVMDGNNVDLKDENDYVAKIKPDCDWIIGSFEKRAAARTAEMEGLSVAKDHLAGAALLQQKNLRGTPVALSNVNFLDLSN